MPKNLSSNFFQIERPMKSQAVDLEALQDGMYVTFLSRKMRAFLPESGYLPV